MEQSEEVVTVRTRAASAAPAASFKPTTQTLLIWAEQKRLCRRLPIFPYNLANKRSDIMNSVNLSRRQMLLSLPGLMMAPRLFAQAGNPPIRVRGINHVTLRVSDLKRSLD